MKQKKENYFAQFLIKNLKAMWMIWYQSATNESRLQVCGLKIWETFGIHWDRPIRSDVHHTAVHHG